jgi:hypothetical protein
MNENIILKKIVILYHYVVLYLSSLLAFDLNLDW